MTKIEEAQARIENGWCRHSLDNGDGRFCSVGSMVKSLNPNLDLTVSAGETGAYELFDLSAEGKALAAAALETPWANKNSEYKEVLQESFDRGVYCEIVYGFNDDQRDMEPVLDLFRVANKIFTESLPVT